MFVGISWLSTQMLLTSEAACAQEALMTLWDDGPTTAYITDCFAWLLLPVRLVGWCTCRILGCDIAPDNTAGGSDGIGILTFFAGLLTTQAAGLVILAQGKGGFNAQYLTIYFCFAAMPLIGIVCTVLRKEATTNSTRCHAFNASTLAFARWVFTYGVLLAVVLPLLGAVGLIPGQNTRVDYPDSYIPTLPARNETALEMKTHLNRAVNAWFATQVKGLTPNSGSDKHLVVVEQDGSFAVDYKEIVSSFSFGANAISTDTIGFLVKNAAAQEATPIFEKLDVLPLDDGGRIAKHSVVIKDAGKGDFVVLFLITEKRDEKGESLPTDPAEYLFQWRVK